MAATSSVPNALELGAATFLNLLGLLGGGNEMPGTETEPGKDSPFLSQTALFSPVPADAPVAAPQQIANALIRSMLTSVERVIVRSMPEAPEVLTVAPAIAIEGPRSEDWDIPFDWVAPEELGDLDEGDSDDVPDWPQAVCAAQVPLQAPLSTQSETLFPATMAPPVSPQVERATTPGPRRPAGPTAPLAFTVTVKPTTSADSSHQMQVPLDPAQAPPAQELAPAEAAVDRPDPVTTMDRGVPNASRMTDSRPSTPPPQPSRMPPDEGPGEGNPDGPEGNDANHSNESAPSRRAVSIATRSETGKDGEPASRIQAPAISSPSVTPSPIHATNVVAIPPRGAATIPDQPAAPKVALESRSDLQVTQGTANPEARPAVAHEIAIRISAPDDTAVDLQVKERGGEVRVAVRTVDVGLQTSLRQDLGSLVDQLEHAGFRAETMIPREVQESGRIESFSNFDLSSAFRTQARNQPDRWESSPDQSSDDRNARQQTGESGGRQSQQRRQNSSQQLKWMQAMEDPA